MSHLCLVPDTAAWQQQFGVSPDLLPAELQRPRYNVGRNAWVPVIRQEITGQRELVLMRWGYVHHSVRASQPRLQPLTIQSPRLFRPYFEESSHTRRCLIPVNGYYTWHGWEDGPGLPYYVRLRSGLPFLMAGVYDTWNGEDRFAIIMARANETLSKIYPWMPAIIDPAAMSQWFAHGQWPLHAHWRELLSTHPMLDLEVIKVSRSLFVDNKDDASLIEPILSDQTDALRA